MSFPPSGDATPSDVLAGLGRAVVEGGLAGLAELELLGLFCEGLRSAGVPISRAVVLLDTLDPVYEGRVFRWWREPDGREAVLPYGRSTAGPGADAWRRSPFFHLVQTGGTSLRRRLLHDELDFPALHEFREEGQSDWLALVARFGTRVIGELDCAYSSWMTDAPGGFSDADVAAITALFPQLALALKASALARTTETLVQTYLGRDAGRRVLEGKIARGVAERINAVLWFSDLANFTRITEAAEPDTIIPFLNDYAEAAIASVHEAGGDVLKLIGDGTLAIFGGASPAESSARALAAESRMRRRLADLDAERRAAGLVTTAVNLGLHVGEVFFGNIGSRDRLDFTVVGPAVNEVSRIVSLCRSVDRDVLASAAFREAAAEVDGGRLVSVGRFAMKGVARAQELFTLDREARS